MSARRVLFVHSSSGRYGADRQLALIAAGLDRERYEPLVVLPFAGELCDDLRASGIEVIVRPLGVLRRGSMTASGLAGVGSAIVRDAAVLGRLIRRRDVALVHSNTSVVLGGAAAAAVARVPHVWHVREIYTGFERAWPAYRRLLLRAAALPCVSYAAAEQFGGAALASVVWDGLAVDVARAPRSAARAALDLDDEVPVIALLARISTWKGQDVLIRALADPALRSVGTVALLAGEPWPGAEARLAALRRLAVEVGVEHRVHFLGFRSDVSNVYGAADLVAVPSTAPDPLPGAAIEAAAAGCAVLASDHGGLPEIVREGETGRLVTPRDVGAFARVARELLDDGAARERLGRAAAADVRRRFGAARLLATVQEIYDGLG